jgi:DNA topoisomerase-3
VWQYVVPADKKKQFAVIKKLMNDKRFSAVIFATDAAREGELIARLIYEKAGCKLPIKRAWLSSMEPKAIVSAFNNLRDGAEFEDLYKSALCRERADWTCGVNLSRLYSKLYNKRLTVGRVQTPTIAMIAERGAAIANFVKEKYFNVNLNDIATLGQIKSQSEAEKIKAECENSTAVVREVRREHKTVNPPKLYDLTQLQREANRLYGLTAQETLDAAQGLYEARLITYPRTSSMFLPDDMAGTAGEIIGIIRGFSMYKNVNFTPDVSKVINSAKCNDHFAIVPTAEIAKVNIDSLPDNQRKILMMIINKLLCATAAKHEYEAVTATIECGGYSFISKGKTVINDGWKAIEGLLYSKSKDDSDSDDNDSDNSLDLAENQTFEKPTCSITEHFTKSKPQYTEDTLLSAMNNAGNDEMSDEVENSGIGTPVDTPHTSVVKPIYTLPCLKMAS